MSLLSLRFLLRERNAFGLEDCFRFALSGFGVIARPPEPTPVMARLVPESQLQVGTALGKVPPSLIRAPEFGAEQGADKRTFCLQRRAGVGIDANKPALCFAKILVQNRQVVSARRRRERAGGKRNAQPKEHKWAERQSVGYECASKHEVQASLTIRCRAQRRERKEQAPARLVHRARRFCLGVGL